MPVDLAPAGLPIVARASLVEDDGPLRAWVERVVRKDPDIRWIVGNYVEADVANDNGHTFPLSDLITAQHTVAGKPLNMLHRDHYIVGAFAGAQLVGADGKELEAAYDPNGGDHGHPYVEAVAGMWHTRFPEEYFNIQRAHKEGTLFFSMEAVPEEVSCPSCAHRTVYAGVASDSYCEHMQGPVGPKVLHNPVFAGGAIIIPPVRPGWSRADVKTISQYVNANESTAQALLAQMQQQAPDMAQGDLEALMLQIMSLYQMCEMDIGEMEDGADSDGSGMGKMGMPMGAVEKGADYSKDERMKMAKQGLALPDGTYPIKDKSDLGDAISLAVFAKDQAKVRAHIIKRAKALGAMDFIPRAWLPKAQAKDYNSEMRQQMAKNGQAMPDGSFPIKDVADLQNAIQSVGRAKNSGAAKSHIKKRARALGRTDLIPEGW